MFAKEHEATKKELVRVQSTSAGSSMRKSTMRKSTSVPDTLNLESIKSFRVTPTVAI